MPKHKPEIQEARLAAKERGDKFYWTGKPCKFGHNSPRYILSNNCIECLQMKRETPDMVKNTENARLRNEARARGDKHYSTGKPCRHGHVAKRFVSTGDCTICVKIKTGVKNAEGTQIRDGGGGKEGPRPSDDTLLHRTRAGAVVQRYGGPLEPNTLRHQLQPKSRNAVPSDRKLRGDGFALHDAWGQVRREERPVPSPGTVHRGDGESS